MADNYSLILRWTMTTRNLLFAITALLLLATFSDRLSGPHVYASEPTLMSAPTAALAELDVSYDSLTPTDVELRRIQNELRHEQRAELDATLAATFADALLFDATISP